MSMNEKRLASLATDTAAATSTVHVTVPIGKSWVVGNLVLTGLGGNDVGATTLSAWHGAASTALPAETLLSHMPLLDQETVAWQAPLNVAGGETLTFQVDPARNVAINVYGLELDDTVVTTPGEWIVVRAQGGDYPNLSTALAACTTGTERFWIEGTITEPDGVPDNAAASVLVMTSGQHFHFANGAEWLLGHGRSVYAGGSISIVTEGQLKIGVYEGYARVDGLKGYEQFTFGGGHQPLRGHDLSGAHFYMYARGAFTSPADSVYGMIATFDASDADFGSWDIDLRADLGTLQEVGAANITRSANRSRLTMNVRHLVHTGTTPIPMLGGASYSGGSYGGTLRLIVNDISGATQPIAFADVSAMSGPDDQLTPPSGHLIEVAYKSTLGVMGDLGAHNNLRLTTFTGVDAE